jgi:hypothetical protein
MSEKLSVGNHRFIIKPDGQGVFFEAENYDNGMTHQQLAESLRLRRAKGGVCSVLWDFNDEEIVQYDSGATSIISATKEEFDEALFRGRTIV